MERQMQGKTCVSFPGSSTDKPEDRVFVGFACAAPQLLIQALKEMPLEDVEIAHILTMGIAPYVEQELEPLAI